MGIDGIRDVASGGDSPVGVVRQWQRGPEDSQHGITDKLVGVPAVEGQDRYDELPQLMSGHEWERDHCVQAEPHLAVDFSGPGSGL